MFLSAVMALALTGGLAACGGGGYDSEKIAADIDAGNATAQSFPDSVTAADKKEKQENADEDAAAAKRALERREELAELEREQQAETERLMDDGEAGDAAKSKDPLKALAAAQAYTDALNDFMAALTNLDAPRSVRADYRSWLGTINALANNARLQVVSYADPKKTERLSKKTQSLFEELVMKSATLGVTCLSATA